MWRREASPLSLEHRQCTPLTKRSESFCQEELPAYLLRHFLFYWKIPEDLGGRSIQRIYIFPDFTYATQFLELFGKVVEKQDHHPEYHYLKRELTVTFTSHLINGVTQNDLIMAAKAEAIYQKLSRTNRWRYDEEHPTYIEANATTPSAAQPR
jgi:4a-hydroxytetrahydrobiopterin dehydratase